MSTQFLSDLVAFITGAASGLGLGAAHRLADAGAKLFLFDQNQDELVAVATKLQDRGVTTQFAVGNVENANDIRAAIDQCATAFGRLDVVFANAGINGVWAPLEELGDDEFDRTLAINLRGTFLTIKYAAPWLKKDGGSVIVTSSVNGTRIFSNTGATAYSASKAGQVAIVKMLAVELGPHQIRLNAICPGAINTNIARNTEQRHTDQVKIPVEFPEGNIPLTDGEPGDIDEIGDLVCFLAGPQSRHISGAVIHIDGAQSLLVG